VWPAGSVATIEQRQTKRGEVRYRALVRLKGCPPQSATFRRLTDARRWVQQTESAIREGRYFRTVEARRHTLAELVDRYVETVLPMRRDTSRRDQLRHLRWWQGRLGVLLLADVSAAVIAEERDRLARGVTVRGRRRSPATVNRYLTSLSHAFTIAVREWEWLERNPVRRVRKLREPRGRVRFLSESERARLLAACRRSDDGRLFPLVVLALSTGARQGELLRLQWPDVDLERNIAVVHQTKNRERRALPIHGLALQSVRELWSTRNPRSDLVFAGRNGKGVFPRKPWERALEAAEISDFRFHDLRHSAASYLAMNGATLTEIAEILGHKTLAMVKRYSHLTEQHTSRVVARMNERVFGGPR
jgi:integrase